MVQASDIEAGHAVYSPAFLRIYDLFVHGLVNHLVWHCPTAALRALYDRNVTAHHLDIGVGTGYFLDKARWPAAHPDITLLDLNPHCLDFTSRRISRFAPRTVVANILEPLPRLGPFDSVGFGYLFHCIPGTIPEKAIAFDYLRPLLAPGARVFGATILNSGLPRWRPSQALMDFYNRMGFFSNAKDTLTDLTAALEQRFDHVRIDMKGPVALFEAQAG
jgi:SAM-dependent methyltransferase